MRVCQFRHFGNEMRQRLARRRDGNYSFIVTGMPGVSNGRHAIGSQQLAVSRKSKTLPLVTQIKRICADNPCRSRFLFINALYGTPFSVPPW